MIWLAMAVLVAGAFLAGLVSGHRKTFPFGLLQRLARRLARRASPPAGDDEAAGFVIDLADAQALQARREALAGFVFGPAGWSSIRPPEDATGGPPGSLERRFRDLASHRRWVVRMDHGIDSYLDLLLPNGPRRRTTVVYQQGHEGDPIHGAHVLQRLLKAGYPVLALAMPLLGDNSQPVVQLRRHGPVRLCDHDFLALVDHEFGRPSIRFFVEPVLAGINRLAAEGADRFAMLGWSGGGWTTTLCAALDPRIRASYSVAGSLPFSQRRRGEMSDYENHLPALYELANYPELYVLSASGPSRSAMQILNEYDTVAWSGRRGLAYERRVQDTLGRLGSGRFSCVIDDTWTGHGISRAALDRILSDLETRCENE